MFIRFHTLISIATQTQCKFYRYFCYTCINYVHNKFYIKWVIFHSENIVFALWLLLDWISILFPFSIVYAFCSFSFQFLHFLFLFMGNIHFELILIRYHLSSQFKLNAMHLNVFIQLFDNCCASVIKSIDSHMKRDWKRKKERKKNENKRTKYFNCQ